MSADNKEKDKGGYKVEQWKPTKKLSGEEAIKMLAKDELHSDRANIDTYDFESHRAPWEATPVRKDSPLLIGGGGGVFREETPVEKAKREMLEAENERFKAWKESDKGRKASSEATRSWEYKLGSSIPKDGNIANTVRQYIEKDLVSEFKDSEKRDAFVKGFNPDAARKALNELKSVTDRKRAAENARLKEERAVVEKGGGSLFAAKSFLRGSNMAEHLYGEDAEVVQLMNKAESAYNDAMDVISAIDRAKKGDDGVLKELWNGFKDSTKRLRTWDWGLSELAENSAFLKLVEKQDRGEELTEYEKATMEMVGALADLSSAFPMSRGYKAGFSTGYSMPFMLDIAMSPAFRLSGALAKSATKALAKKGAMGAVKKGAIKAGVDMMVGASGTTATIGLPRALADSKRRQFEDGDNEGDALVKSLFSSYIEYASEAAGEVLDPLGAGVAKGAKGILGKSKMLNKAFSKLSASDFGRRMAALSNSTASKTAKKMMDAVKFNGFLVENAEELIGNVTNALTVGDVTADELKSVDTYIDTALPILVTQFAFGGVTLAGYGIELKNSTKQLKHTKKVLSAMMDAHEIDKVADELGKMSITEQTAAVKHYTHKALEARSALSDKNLGEEERKEIETEAQQAQASAEFVFATMRHNAVIGAKSAIEEQRAKRFEDKKSEMIDEVMFETMPDDQGRLRYARASSENGKLVQLLSDAERITVQMGGKDLHRIKSRDGYVYVRTDDGSIQQMRDDEIFLDDDLAWMDSKDEVDRYIFDEAERRAFDWVREQDAKEAEEALNKEEGEVVADEVDTDLPIQEEEDTATETPTVELRNGRDVLLQTDEGAVHVTIADASRVDADEVDVLTDEGDIITVSPKDLQEAQEESGTESADVQQEDVASEEVEPIEQAKEPLSIEEEAENIKQTLGEDAIAFIEKEIDLAEAELAELSDQEPQGDTKEERMKSFAEIKQRALKVSSELDRLNQIRSYLNGNYITKDNVSETDSSSVYVDTTKTDDGSDVFTPQEETSIDDTLPESEDLTEQEVAKEAEQDTQQREEIVSSEESEATDKDEQQGVEQPQSTTGKIAAAREDVEQNPTEKQKEAGNYKKGHVSVDGLKITIENPRGGVRSGVDAKGNKWSTTMHNDYGYFLDSKTVDGDHLDVFLSDNPEAGDVFVIDQVNRDGSFDEHKVMYGFASEDEARTAYLSNYEKGWTGLGEITQVSKEDFKEWLKSSKRKTKPFAEYKVAKEKSTKEKIEAEREEAYRKAKEREADMLGETWFDDVLERQELTEDREKGKAKGTAKDFCEGKDGRETLQGIYHKDGEIYASDGTVLLREKKDYPKELEGKIVDGERTIDKKYPNAKEIIDRKEASTRFDLSGLSDFVQAVEAAAKKAWKSGKKKGGYKAFRDTVHITLDIDGERLVTTLTVLDKVISGATRLGLDKIDVRENKSVLLSDGNGNDILFIAKSVKDHLMGGQWLDFAYVVKTDSAKSIESQKKSDKKEDGYGENTTFDNNTPQNNASEKRSEENSQNKKNIHNERELEREDAKEEAREHAREHAREEAREHAREEARAQGLEEGRVAQGVLQHNPRIDWQRKISSVRDGVRSEGELDGNVNVSGREGGIRADVDRQIEAADDYISEKLGDKLKEDYNKVLTQQRVKRADSKEFHEAIQRVKEGNRNGWMVDMLSLSDYDNYLCLLTEDGKSGIAVKPDGDIVSVFSTVQKDNRLEKLMMMAIAAGGRKLDCYYLTVEDGYRGLPDLYKRFGFKVIATTPFNAEYAPDAYAEWKESQSRWDVDGVAAMVYEPSSSDMVESYSRNNESGLEAARSFVDEEKDGTMSYGYDEALKARDEYLDNLSREESKGDDRLAGEDEGEVRFRQSTEESEIERKAKADGTWMKAPNGKQTNLTERQWVQVRTKAFKTWFGDWEKRARIYKLIQSEPIKITGKEYEGKYELNRDSAKKWVKANIKGEYINKDTNEKIVVSNVGVKEVTSHGERDEAHLKSLIAIPKLISNSIFVEEIPNTKENNKYDSYRYYVCGLNIGGIDYTAKVVIGVKGDSRYYDHRLTEIEKGTLINNLNGLSNTVAENQNTSNSISKDSKLLSILQINASKVVDENGEPLVVYHGSPSKFTVFDDKFMGRNGTSQGQGFYFTPDKRKADGYGDGHLIEAFLNIRDYLSRDKRTIGKNSLRSILEQAHELQEKEEEYSGLLYNYGDVNADGKSRVLKEAVDLEHDGADNDLDLFGGLVNSSGNRGIIAEAFRAITGKDGVINNELNEIVILNPNQVKSATENVGTFDGENNDIRFRGSDNAARVNESEAEREERDRLYREAVENNDEELIQQLLSEEADRKGYSTESDYQGTSAFNGAAPSSNGYYETLEERKEAWSNDEFEGDWSLADELVEGIAMGGLESRISASEHRRADSLHKEAIQAIRDVREAIRNGKKGVEIKLYRSVPNSVKETSLRNGDWVTPSLSYAKDNASVHGWGDDYRIIEESVPIEHVWWDGNDVAEWGYDNGKEEAYKNTPNNKKTFAVTYDDNGDLIALSDRFNDQESDVRFSQRNDSAASAQSAWDIIRNKPQVQRSERMRARAESLSEELKTDIHIVYSRDLKGKRAKAKGWYDTKTGEVTVVLNNNLDEQDIEATIMHEVVAHKGLRGLLGEDGLNDMLDLVHNSIPSGLMDPIAEAYHNPNKSEEENRRIAAEEYIATLAESYVNPSTIKKIAAAVRAALRKVGIHVKMLDGDIMYMLYLSKNRLMKGDSVTREDEKNGLLSKAKRLAEKYNNYMFRMSEEEVERDLFEDAPMHIAARLRVMTKGFAYKLKEGHQDAMKSWKYLQGLIGDVKDSENVYVAENLMSSKAADAAERFANDVMKPLEKTIRKFKKKCGLSDDVFSLYLMAKHVPERNAYYINRELIMMERRHEEQGTVGSEEYQNEYDSINEMDFSGRRAIEEEIQSLGFDSLDAFVDDIELKAGQDVIDGLWSRVKDATMFSLDEWYDSGMMTIEKYNEIKGRYLFYVPLRGHKEDVASDIFDYYKAEVDPRFASVDEAVKGRKSVADDPIPYIEQMGYSAIVGGARNKMKMYAYRLAKNHPNDAIIEGALHYEVMFDAEGNVIGYDPIYLDIMPGDSPEIIRDKRRIYNSRIQEGKKNGSVIEASMGSMDVKLFATPEQLREHLVTLKMAGKKYFLVTPHNPQLAQSLMGMNRKHLDSDVLRSVAHLKNYMARAYTSLNPEFVMKNFFRDVTWAFGALYVREGIGYTVSFSKNLALAFGEMAKGRKNSQILDEFFKNGGFTGFSNMQRESDYKRAYKRKASVSMSAKVNRGVRKGERFIFSLNETMENATRLAVYMTSREIGRSAQQSASDAKESTVNFNRRGSGQYGGLALGTLYAFYNAGIQGFDAYSKLWGTNFVRCSVLHTMGILLGAAPFIINSIIGGDDDEMKKMLSLSEYTRRNNIVIPLGDDSYIKIPLSIEARAWHAVGDILGGFATGKIDGKEASIATIASMLDMAPLNVTDAHGGIERGIKKFDQGDHGNALLSFFGGVAPTIITPAVEVWANVGYTGAPVFYENDFNRHLPAYRKASSRTNRQFVSASKFLNNISGGDAVKPGNININPSIVDNLLSGYIGGLYTFSAHMLNMGNSLLSGEAINWSRAPITNGFFLHDGRILEKQVSRDYREEQEEAKLMEKRLKEYEKIATESPSWIEREKAERKINEMEEDGLMDKIDASKEFGDIVKNQYKDMKDAAPEKKKEAEEGIVQTKQMLLNYNGTNKNK